MDPMIIAHRCGPGKYPEQSLTSASHALALGADMVEMDVQYTRDGVPVICHDPNALRVFGVDRLVRDMTLEEFRALRHAGNPEYRAHTLEDVFASEVRPLLLHCKFTGALLEDLAGRIRSRGEAGNCVPGVLNVSDVDIVHRACPEIRVLAFMPEPEQLEGFLKSRATFIRLWEDWVTPERVRAVHSAGKRLWVMAGQPVEGSVGYTSGDALLHWRDLGADAVLVNDVAWAKGVLEEKRRMDSRE